MKEKRLLHKIRKGDMGALDALITDVYPTVYAFVYRKMQGDDVAKDITQEVFIRFVRYLPTYHDEGKLLHLLYRIASNLCIDEYRRSSRNMCEDSDTLAYCLADDTDVHESILQQCSQAEILYYISQLSPPQQDVIILHYYHELTYKEIACIYDMPISSIKSRHKAALQKLFVMMKGDGGHERR